MVEVNWNKKSQIKNENHFKNGTTRLCDKWKMLQCWWEMGHLTLFFVSTLQGIWELKSARPREIAIQGKKNGYALGSARRGTGVCWAKLLMHKVLKIAHYNQKGWKSRKWESLQEIYNSEFSNFNNILLATI